MSKKFLLVALVFAAVAFLLTPVLWPLSDDPAHMPPDSLMPLFQLIGVLSSLTFGIGAAFLLYAYKPMRKAEPGYGLGFWSYLSVSWMLLSWWPHENLHRVFEGDYYALIWLEYGFHATLYVTGIILALYLLRRFKGSVGSDQPQAR